VLFPSAEDNYLGFIYNFQRTGDRTDFGVVYIKGNESYAQANPHYDFNVSRPRMIRSGAGAMISVGLIGYGYAGRTFHGPLIARRPASHWRSSARAGRIACAPT
jgi:hypothetical protein